MGKFKKRLGRKIRTYVSISPFFVLYWGQKGGERMEKILDPRGYSMEEIYQAYEGLCVKLVNRYGLDPSYREDLMQECALELCRCVRDYNPDRGVAFPAYVSRALKYGIFGAQRKWRKGEADSLDIGEDFKNDLEDDVNIEEEFCKKEDQARVREALKGLSPRQGEVLTLYYDQGLSLSEIAGFLGLAYKTVENTKAAGLKKLRRIFDVNGKEVDSL